MPRYLMDGVFLHDFMDSGLSGSIHEMVSYADRYFAQYPALSIGHHPPGLALSLVPFFSIFGISIAAGRLAIITFLLLAVLFLYSLVGHLYDDVTAGWACLLFASHRFIGFFGQRVLSEMPTIALVLAALTCLVRFRAGGRLRDYLLFLITALLAVSTRQLAVFMFPAYGVAICLDGGWKHLKQRRVVMLTAAAAAAFALIAAATVMFSPFNVSVIRDVLKSGSGPANSTGILREIVRDQLRLPLSVVAALGLMASAFARDRRIIFAAVWIAAILAGVMFVTGPVEPARYSILAFPAYCIAGATLWSWSRSASRPIGVALTLVLVASVASQFVSARTMRPDEAPGYEEAATYVLSQQRGPTVLFSGSIDAGFFVFFVRKHDAAQRLVVLRSDKILTTSFMNDVSIENRISSPEEIYTVLKRFGTVFVVIEDHPTGSVVLDWLRNELRTNRFAERRRYPSGGNEIGRPPVDVVVYEYLEATPPDPNAELDLKLPVVGREIRVPLSQLVNGQGRR